ncbi:MAG: DUF4845 domain-containing protein [Pseudomonadota bacterium]
MRSYRGALQRQASHRRQRGIGLLGMLIIAVMVGFFVMSAIRITPGYFEYLSVREVVIRVAEEYDPNADTFTDLRRKLADYFNTNQIKALHPREIELSRDEGKVVINANYELRIPLVWRIDAVVKYDDLVFIAGQTYSD